MVTAYLPVVAPGERGPLARLDPRVRLLWLAAFFVLTVAAGKLPTLGALAAWVLLLAIVSGATGRMVRSVVGLTWIVVLVSIMNGFAYGPYAGILTAAKFVVALAGFAVFFWVSDVDDLADGLAGVGVPDRFAFILTGGMALVPSVGREFGEIVDAYRARGIPLDAGWQHRITHYPRLLFPLVVSTVGRALRLAAALEVRGFGAAPRRTMLRELRMRGVDWIALALIVALSGIVAGIALAV